MRDPYDILGVKRTASDAEIKAAYRKLAKQHHPDLHQGDAAAEGRFKEISLAFGLLGDPDKRRRFDAGEIDASGAERPQHPFHRGPQGGGGRWRPFEGEAGGDFSSVFDDLFGRSGRSRRGPARAPDVTYSLTIDFLDAVNGSRQTVTLPTGDTLAIRIPPGTADGDKLRLKGKGPSGGPGMAAGDALVEVRVRPHEVFARDGTTIRSTVPISLDEAVLGAKIPVRTVDGEVKLTIPAGTSSGKTFRLKGKGVPQGDGRGDHLVEVQIVVPATIDPELRAFMERWAERHPFRARDDA